VLDHPYCDSIIISFSFKSEQQNPNININTSSILHNIHTQVNNNHLLPTPHTNNKSDHQSQVITCAFTPLTHQQSIYLSIQHCTSSHCAAPPDKQTNTNAMASSTFMTVEQQPRRDSRPKASLDSARPAAHKGGALKRAAHKIASAAKHHHQQVNAAFDAVYGTKYYH
jgi:hypothetical protein